MKVFKKLIPGIFNSRARKDALRFAGKTAEEISIIKQSDDSYKAFQKDLKLLRKNQEKYGVVFSDGHGGIVYGLDNKAFPPPKDYKRLDCLFF